MVTGLFQRPHTQITPRSAALATAAALILCAGSFLSVAATCNDIGWTWDEVYYFSSSELQIDWFRALCSWLAGDGTKAVLSREVLDAYWQWDLHHNPHPPLYKILASLGLLFFRDMLGDRAAFRMASALLAGMLVLFLFRAVRKRYGSLPAAYAGAALLLMPRFFGHAHLATTEIPVAAFWLFSCCAFWHGRESVRGSVLLGLILGCALAVKFTAVLIPLPFLLWAITYREKKALRNIACMCMISPLVALALNPGWWYDPIDKITAYITMSLSRAETIPLRTFFLGKAYLFSPPWYYPLVMTAVTVPAATLCTIALGAVRFCRKGLLRPYDALFLCPVPFILVVVMLPQSPVHDGVRQFFAVFPFLAYAAAAGYYHLGTLSARLPLRPVMQRCVWTGCLAALVLQPALQLLKSHPYELSYYNGLIGGLQGAYRKGMEITYWFDAVNDRFLEGLSRAVPDGASVSVWPHNPDYFIFLQEHKKIKQTIRFVAPEITGSVYNDRLQLIFSPQKPDFLILVSRLGEFNPLYRYIFTRGTPLFSLKHEGVPLAAIYRW